MKKIILSIVLFLFLSSPASANVYIPEEHRIKNFSPGYCCWVCLETLGRNQHIEELYNLAEGRTHDPDYIEDGVVYPKNVGTEGAVRDKLGRMNVRFRITNYNYDDLQLASDTNACVIFMSACEQWGGDHAIILTHIDKDHVEFIDPNYCTYFKASLDWFRDHWYGTAISLN